MSQTPGLGARIATLRERRGLLQKDLAQKAELSVSFLSEVENDKRTPGAELLLRIANVLGASLDYLLRGEAVAPEPQPVTIPPNLNEAAEERHWSYSVTTALLRAQSSVIGRRTPEGSVERPIKDWKKEDWIRLHDVLYGS